MTSTPSTTRETDLQDERRRLAQKLMKRLHQFLPILALIIFAVALGFIRHILKQHSYSEIIGYMRSIPLRRRWIALGGTILSYLLLSGYDLLGFRYIKNPIAWHKIAFGSFTAFAFSNNIGLANLAGSSIRLRIYSTYGVEPQDTLKIIAFNSATFWIGFFALAGTMLCYSPIELPPSFGVSMAMVQVAGFLLLSCALAYLCTSALRRKPVVIYGYSFELPRFGLSLSQVLIAAGDWALAGFVLYILLPADTGLSFPQFLTIFVSAQVVALITHVPGGVGILEALVIYFVAPDHQSNPAVLGGLLAYRAIYYLLPLVTAAVFLFTYEIYRKRHVVRRVGLGWTGPIIPSVASLLTFMAGALMLFASATPLLRSRLELISAWLPLAVIEASYFLTSCIGAALLIIGHALLNRSHAAWLLTMILLVIGAFLSLTRGFEYESALLLIFFASLLFASRGEFHRRPALYATRLTPTWAAAVAMVVGGSIWIGLFAHRHVEYTSDLWWAFPEHGGVPRFLRASLGALATCIGMALYYLLRPNSLLREQPLANRHLAAEQITSLAKNAFDSMAQLALAGDKLIFPSASGKSCLMYAKLANNKIWCALSDPFGQTAEAEDLLFDFKEAANADGSAAIFHEILSEKLPLYVDLELIFAPIAEQGFIDVQKFEPGAITSDNLTKYELDVFEPEQSATFLPELVRRAAETARPARGLMSVPLTIEALRSYPIAILRSAGELRAFAPVFMGASEMALDTPWFALDNDPLAEIFIVKMLLWAKLHGFHTLNLGITPILPLVSDKKTSISATAKTFALLLENNLLTLKTRFLAYPSSGDLPEYLLALTRA